MDRTSSTLPEEEEQNLHTHFKDGKRFVLQRIQGDWDARRLNARKESSSGGREPHTGRDAWKERVCMEKEGQIPYADCKQLENTLFASV